MSGDGADKDTPVNKPAAEQTENLETSSTASEAVVASSAALGDPASGAGSVFSNMRSDLRTAEATLVSQQTLPPLALESGRLAAPDSAIIAGLPLPPQDARTLSPDGSPLGDVANRPVRVASLSNTWAIMSPPPPGEVTANRRPQDGREGPIGAYTSSAELKSLTGGTSLFPRGSQLLTDSTAVTPGSATSDSVATPRADSPDSTVRAGGGGRRGPVETVRTVPYVVQPGDTLWSISQRNKSDSSNTPTQTEIDQAIGPILEVNPGLHPDRLRVGQTIKIPEEIRTGVRQYGTEQPLMPTALVLDDFHQVGSTALNRVNATHGEILASGFNAMGFNVLRANESSPEIGRGTGRYDFSGAMERVGNYIEANQDKFPPGSFVNTSFGNRDNGPRTGDMTFTELSTMLKMTVTADTVGQQRNEILNRLGHVAAGRDPVTGQPSSRISAHDRRVAEAAVKTNQQIERIQALGVEVIHSAGNDGPNRIDINFLRATNLRSDGPNGRPLGFSGVGSHTEHGAGILTFHLNPDGKSATAYPHGYGITFPTTKAMPFSGPWDRVVDPSKLPDPAQQQLRGEPFPFMKPGEQHKYDDGAYRLGYEQVMYRIGRAIDYTSGTSFAPFSYVARTRMIPRPPER